MQLWLQGRSRWRRSASWRPVSPPGLPQARLRRRRRRCAGEFTAPQLAVSSQPALALPADRLDNVTLLREFCWMKPRQPDGRPAPAPAGRDVALNWLYQDRHLGWLALVFASDRPEEVDRQITHWLQALQQTTPEQQQHYYQLSRRRQALSPRSAAPAGIRLCPGAPPAGFADFAPPCKPPRRSAGLSDRFPSLLPPGL